MHELGITENILSIVLSHAKEEGANRISKVTLKFGEMTQIVDESIRFHFDILSKDTIAEEAELVIERIPIRVRCSKCGETKEASDYNFICPSCGNICVEFVSGKEMFVDAIETE